MSIAVDTVSDIRTNPSSISPGLQDKIEQSNLDNKKDGLLEGNMQHSSNIEICL